MPDIAVGEADQGCRQCAAGTDRQGDQTAGAVVSRYAKRRDANEPDIRDALVKAGCDVIQADDVDLIVGRAGHSYLIEVKRPGRASESRIRPIQKRLRDNWRGHYAIVTTADDALAAVGLKS
jgi:hypothetical protein